MLRKPINSFGVNTERDGNWAESGGISGRNRSQNPVPDPRAVEGSVMDRRKLSRRPLTFNQSFDTVYHWTSMRV